MLIISMTLTQALQPGRIIIQTALAELALAIQQQEQFIRVAVHGGVQMMDGIVMEQMETITYDALLGFLEWILSGNI